MSDITETTALYDSECHFCEGPIGKGDPVLLVDNDWAHLTCIDDEYRDPDIGAKELPEQDLPGMWEYADFIDDRQPTRSEQAAALVAEVRRLRNTIARVQALADAWTARGEHDMAYSKTIPDENIADYLLGAGAELVEKARHIHTALHPGEEPHA